MPKSGQRTENDNNNTESGRVVASYGRRVLIEDMQGNRVQCALKGRRLRAVCGDRVHWYRHDNSGIVTAIGDRDNELQRPDSRGLVEVLAANIGQIAVVIAPEPQVDDFVADRYLAAARLMGSECLVACNKQELGPVSLADEYRSIGYTVVNVSAKTGHGMDQLAAALRDQTSILVGQSGVGKSSLSNALVPGLDVLTQTLSQATGEGRHTTTTAIMHELPGGGEIIDSPGVRDFAPPPTEPSRVDLGFPEFDEAVNDCRFNDCLHLREPGCGVLAAVETGEIFARRYRSYKELLRLMQRLRAN